MQQEILSQSDKDIVDEIEKALLLEEDISTDNIIVTCKDGKVTLRGSVDRLEDKQRIEDIVEDIPGVILVNNEIEVVKL